MEQVSMAIGDTLSQWGQSGAPAPPDRVAESGLEIRETGKHDRRSLPNTSVAQVPATANANNH